MVRVWEHLSHHLVGGACESIVWDYYINLKDIFDVTIFNDKNLKNIINEINKNNFDIVHIMYDDHINMVPNLKCEKIFYTSHYAYIIHPDFETKFKNNFIINKQGF